MFTVVITEKEGSERRLTFTEPEVTIGRVPGNDVVLPKGNVSKRHSRIVLKDNRFIVVDLKSTNGTYVNGRKITSPLVVKEGDKIYVGDFVLTLEGDPASNSLVSSMKQPSLMPEAMDNSDDIRDPRPSLSPSIPPPLPSRAPDPISSDDMPAVLRAPTMSSTPPTVTNESVRIADDATSPPVERPVPIERLGQERPAPEHKQPEQTNVVSYSNGNGAAEPAAAVGSVPPVLATFSTPPPPPASAMASVRSLHPRKDGLGPLDALLDDNSVFHVLVERFDRVYVDRGNGLTTQSAAFSSAEALLNTIRKLCAEAGIEASHASYDFTLPSGLHVVCVLPMAASDGPLLSLRRRPARAQTFADLEKAGLLDEAQSKTLTAALTGHRPVWVVGPPGTDLSGLVSALIGGVPRGERLALFERSPEVALGSRPAVCLKLGADDLPSLLERVRHFRPDRLVMHELREAELKDALLAFAQRHDGGIGSMEHRSAKDALAAFDRSIGPDIVLRAAAYIVEAARADGGKTRVAAVHQIELDATGDLVLKPA